MPSSSTICTLLTSIWIRILLQSSKASVIQEQICQCLPISLLNCTFIVDKWHCTELNWNITRWLHLHKLMKRKLLIIQFLTSILNKYLDFKNQWNVFIIPSEWESSTKWPRLRLWSGNPWFLLKFFTAYQFIPVNSFFSSIDFTYNQWNS